MEGLALGFTCVEGMQLAEVKMRSTRRRGTSDEQRLERQWQRVVLDLFGYLGLGSTLFLSDALFIESCSSI